MPERKSTWQLQEAKNKLSEVIRRAREEGPQTITVRGEPAVLVVEVGHENAKTSRSAATLRQLARRWAGRFDEFPDLELPVRETGLRPVFLFDEDE